MKCFVDTSSLYALVTPNDDDHRATVALFEFLARSDALLVSSNYVILESVSLIQKRHGFAPAQTLLEKALSLLDVHWIGEAEHREASRIWATAKNRALSLVDCSSFAVMHLLGVRHAVTLDSHFSERGFVVMSVPPEGFVAERRGVYRTKPLSKRSAR